MKSRIVLEIEWDHYLPQLTRPIWHELYQMWGDWVSGWKQQCRSYSIRVIKAQFIYICIFTYGLLEREMGSTWIIEKEKTNLAPNSSFIKNFFLCLPAWAFVEHCELWSSSTPSPMQLTWLNKGNTKVEIVNGDKASVFRYSST